MLFFSHAACLAHDPGAGHAERPARLDAVVGALRRAFPADEWREAPMATRDALRRAHAPALIAQVRLPHCALGWWRSTSRRAGEPMTC